MASPPNVKRGLVARFCKHTRLFPPRARRWQYNHGATLEEFDATWRTDSACRSLHTSAEFYVPMVYDLSALATARPPNRTHTTSLLGMNEPSDHKNETGRAVAARWHEMEAIADRSSPALLLGSPSPGGLELKKGERWLHEFMAHCVGCRVDFLALHWYECDGSTEATAEASARAMMGWLSSVHQRFGRRPIWLTEFNCGDGAAPQPLANQSADHHLRFMRMALPLLEAASFVHQYAWFQTWQRHTPMHPGHNPGCSLTSLDGSAKSALGRFYAAYDLKR